MASTAYTRPSKPPGPAGERRPPRLAKELGRIKHKLGIGLAAGCCLGLLTYISFARLFATYSPVFESTSSLLIRNEPPASKDPIFPEATKIDEKEDVVVTKPGGDPKVIDDEADVKPKGTRGGEEEQSRVLSEPDPNIKMMEPAPKKYVDGHKSNEEMLGEGDRKGKEERGHAEEHKIILPTVSDYSIHDEDDTENAKKEGTSNGQQGSKALCDISNFRANVCEMHGDVRLHPRASSILYMEPAGSRRNEVWKIH